MGQVQTFKSGWKQFEAKDKLAIEERYKYLFEESKGQGVKSIAQYMNNLGTPKSGLEKCRGHLFWGFDSFIQNL